MRLWLISQTENDGYDTFDSAVVAAKNENDARLIHPKKSWGVTAGTTNDSHWDAHTWAIPDRVTVKYVGTAAPGTEDGTVICASFNAG